MATIKFAHHSIGDTISELAAALTKTGNCPDLPGKLVAFSKESLNLSCEAVALKVVADLVEAADSSSSTFKTYLANFIKALFAIAAVSEAKDKDGVRAMAVEVLLCILEDDDMRPCFSIPEFASEFVPILLELMLKFESDKIDQDKTTLGEDTIHFSGKALNRVASKIGEENVKNIIFAHILKYLKRDEWLAKLVAIMAINRTIRGRAEEGMDTFLDEAMEIMKGQLNDQHLRLKLITWQFISFIEETYQPVFQKSYAKKVFLPLLVNMFDDPSQEVRRNSIRAFRVIAKATETEEVMPFADQFMEKFLEKIKPEHPMATRHLCIIGIAYVAHVTEKKFMKYYSTVVPVIKRIIVSSSTEEEKKIRGEAMDCIVTISESVGVEMIQADAHEVMQTLLHINGVGLKADHPLKEDIQKTFTRMCRTLKGEFMPYLPQLIPNALKVLNFEPQPHNDKKVDGEVTTIVADGKCTELTHTEIDEIGEAVNLLYTVIKVLGAQFGEYLMPAAQALLPLLSFDDDDVNSSALTTLAEVFTAARDSSDPATRQMLSLWVAEVLEKVLKDLIPCDNDAGITDPDLSVARAKARGLSNCLHNAGPDVLNAQQVGAICEKVFRLLKESNQRRAEIATRKYEQKQSLKQEQSLRSELFDLIWVVMSFHADLYLQTGAELCNKFIETHLDPNCSALDRASALYAFGNVLGHLKDKSAPLWPKFAPRLVECIGDPDFVVREASAYGVKQAAKCPQFPAELIQKAAAQLFALISEKQSKKKAFLPTTEKMIAALGTIVVHRSSCLQPSPEQFVNLWINNLPLNRDYEEGCRTLGDLVDLLAQKNPEILGPQNANLPKLAEICASSYKAHYTDAKVDEKIKDAMQKIGFDVMSSAGANFDEKLQKKLKRIHHDSQI